MPARARAGYAPWSEGFRAITKTEARKQGMEWDLSAGWHRTRPASWKKDPEKGQKIKVILPSGRETWVWESKGYDDYVGFHSGGEELDRSSEMGAYIEEAFNDDVPAPERGYHIKVVKEGHIALLEYAQKYQCLRVTFRNRGDIVVYMRVPSALAGMLFSLAANNLTKETHTGKNRHILGIRFWDLVRIRGQLHGSRYKFTYYKHGNYKYLGTNKLTSAAIRDKVRQLAEAQGEHGSGQETYAVHAADYTDKYGKTHARYEAAITFDEAMRFLDNSEAVNNRTGRLYPTLTDTENEELIELRKQFAESANNLMKEHQAAVKEYLDSRKEAGAGQEALLRNELLMKANPKLAEFMHGLEEHEMQQRAKKSFHGKYFNSEERDYYGGDKGIEQLYKATKEYKKNSKAAFLDMLGEYGDRRSSHGAMKKNAYNNDFGPFQVFDGNQDAMKRYIALERKARMGTDPVAVERFYTKLLDRNGWTREQIQGMATRVAPEHVIPFNKLLKNKDYVGALEFLKSHKGPGSVYKAKNGRTVKTKPTTYAGGRDYITDMEEE